MAHDNWGGPSSGSSKTGQDQISYSFMPKENTIRLKKGQFALGDG